ncbi:MAG: molybdopterin-dependent oxidoreductase [Desulfurococcaceae archaeon]
MNGKPLEIEHDYPAGLIIPRLYGWKSAKRVYKILFLNEYRDSYWKALGYPQR